MRQYFKKRLCSSISAFTLIELLVVIGIIAILMVTVVIVMNPGQLLAQSRDSNRLSDIASIDTSLRLASIDSLSFGSANTVYISIPDNTATTTAGDQCQGLGLPSLPATYSYHCAASSTYRSTNGTGWIPVNMTQISQGTPLSQLPIDPVNTSSSRSYYTYSTNGTQFEVTMSPESQKYKTGGGNDVISSDGGSLASVYEKGTKLGLEPLDYGDSSLVGYWTFDEGTGSVAYDYSGSNATGSWQGTLGNQWTTGKIGSGAGSFNGSNNYVNMGNNTNLSTANAITVGAWVKFNGLDYISNTGNLITIGGKGTPDSAPGTPTAGWWFSYDNRNNGKSFNYTCFGNSNGGYAGGGNNFGSISYTFLNNIWYYIVFTVNTSNNQAILYINCSQIGNSVTTNNLTLANITDPFHVGLDQYIPYYWNGLIDDVRIYNRALSASEIQAMYNGGK